MEEGKEWPKLYALILSVLLIEIIVFAWISSLW